MKKERKKKTDDDTTRGFCAVVVPLRNVEKEKESNRERVCIELFCVIMKKWSYYSAVAASGLLGTRRIG